MVSEEDDNRRKRVAFRCHHTGMRENDLLFGAFVDRHLHELSDADVDWLERLVMEHDDLDLNNWMTGRAPVPVELDHPVMRALKSFKFTV